MALTGPGHGVNLAVHILVAPLGYGFSGQTFLLAQACDFD
jgi:hypothetical protein